MYRQTISFDTLSQTAVRTGSCGVCGLRGRQQRTFTMTENPWNKNPDGTVRTRREIYKALREQADEWERAPFVHPGCREPS
jgi:hypothetical protein